ncbi:MAG: hypothetical protein PHI12_08245 [Dehalococcoidales bacterium]|nr:hypothetical protein [Dehalococcoidales bacterium]
MSFNFLIDWELEEDEFKKELSELMKGAQETNSVIPLPLNVQSGEIGFSMITALISQVKCDACDANCCKRGPNNCVSLSVKEHMVLFKKYHTQVIKSVYKPGERSDFIDMQYPCTLLDNLNHCLAQDEKPFACLIYPLQFGAKAEGKDLFALASSCPEGRRIARQIFLYRWQLRRSVMRLGVGNL